jgi:hypothetical protein
MPAYDLADDELHQIFNKGLIDPGAIGNFFHSRELALFPLFVRRRQIMLSLQHTNLVGAAEALSQDMDESRVDIVNRLPIGCELRCYIDLFHAITFYSLKKRRHTSFLLARYSCSVEPAEAGV